MKCEYVKTTVQEVQVEFTAKMTKKELEDLVTNLSYTSIGSLKENGCPVDAASRSYAQYILFKDILRKINSAV